MCVCVYTQINTYKYKYVIKLRDINKIVLEVYMYTFNYSEYIRV